jgi:hypothetical protein
MSGHCRGASVPDLAGKQLAKDGGNLQKASRRGRRLPEGGGFQRHPAVAGGHRQDRRSDDMRQIVAACKDKNDFYFVGASHFVSGGLIGS